PDGRRFASGCADGHVRVFTPGALQPKGWHYLDDLLAMERFAPDGLGRVLVSGVVTTFSPNGRQLLVGAAAPAGWETARLVDVLTGGIRDLLPERKTLVADAVRAAGVAALPSGRGSLSILGAVPVPRARKGRVESVAFG